jgi:hypothetical protein
MSAMRYLAALLLALLGIGTIPLSLPTLVTPAGLVLAAMGIALLIIAYRLARPKRSPSTHDNWVSPSRTEPLELANTQEHPPQHSTAYEERLWSIALAELEGPARRQGLWAKLFSEAAGNESVAKATYLQQRVEELQREPPAFVAELQNRGYTVEHHDSRWTVVDPGGIGKRYFSSLRELESQVSFLLNRIPGP